jgi:uncharacterized membrane protein
METKKQQFSRHVSVPSDQGIRVDKAVTIERPVSDVYSFCRRLENLRHFMRHVRSVTVQDDLRSHWVVEAIGGKTLEWEAEIIEQRENEMISWRSIPGADVDSAGSVWFTTVPGGQGTLVRVELKYVPAGAAGSLVAKIFGGDADSEIGEDLGRLKSLLETGRLPEESEFSRWQQTKVTARQTATRVGASLRENPWLALASAVAIGFVIGWCLSPPARRRRGLGFLAKSSRSYWP